MFDPITLLLATLLSLQTAGGATNSTRQPSAQQPAAAARQSTRLAPGDGTTASAAMSAPGDAGDARAQIIDTGAP